MAIVFCLCHPSMGPRFSSAEDTDVQLTLEMEEYLQWGRASAARKTSKSQPNRISNLPSMGPRFSSAEDKQRAASRDTARLSLQWGRASAARKTRERRHNENRIPPSM